MTCPAARVDLLGSVHAYMAPVGALLLALSAAGGVGWWRAWQALGRRLDGVRAALAASWRGGRSPAPPATAAPSQAARWAALVLLLSGLQLPRGGDANVIAASSRCDRPLRVLQETARTLVPTSIGRRRYG